MTESKIYADNYRCSFLDSDQFLEFLKDRKENSLWMTAPSNSLQFRPLVKDSEMGNLYMQLYQSNGRADILADTMENTSLLLSVNGQDYPVRSCALKTILERARISGNALGKVSKTVLTQILNYCLDVATGDSLIKVADEKVSAVHGGDPSDYAVLEMQAMFQTVKDFLDREFPGNTFLTANYDHSIVTAIWSLDGQARDLLDTYNRELAAHGLYGKVKVTPGLRFTTSDVGMSGANLFPILLNKQGDKIIPLGAPIKTEHSNGVMGRVLAAAGYGTQFCGAADMFGEDVVDAPMDLGAMEDNCGEVASTANHVMHETKQFPVQPTVPEQRKNEPAPAPAPQQSAPTTLEDYLNSMTLEDAKKVKIDVGYNRGSTLGDIAIRKPSDLEWYVNNYSGRNLALKAGAILLVDAAKKMAS